MSAADDRRWFAHPVMSGMLAAGWLMLQQSLDAGNVIAAVALALVIPRLAGGFMGPGVTVRAAPTALRLMFIVTLDIVMSNIAVARLVLSPAREPQPAWVPVPLDIEHPVGIALFASIITMTPGTVSCIVDETKREILVHALDCDDPVAAARDMKARYEAPLKEIFG
ncbi:Na+/H+ antiporter subunit E [Methyloversatilis sp.]|uniref:Na+/H+ antiporter subunit E n=1 Tax=Methyloversatilis sp. TaxID=2569862 RepID=UPI0035ADFC36